MPGKKAVFAGTMQVPGISVPVRIICSGRRTLGVKVDAGGTVTVQAPFGTREQDIVTFLCKQAGRIEEYVRQSRQTAEQAEAAGLFSEDAIRRMAEQARQVIPGRVAYYAKLLGVSYGTITIRNQRSRWGSCTSRGNLNFNCLLMAAPPEVLDSVVAHELCHRKHMNHSGAFYAELYRVFPDYDRCRTWLREQGPLLMRRMTG